MLLLLLLSVASSTSPPIMSVCWCIPADKERHHSAQGKAHIE